VSLAVVSGIGREYFGLYIGVGEETEDFCEMGLRVGTGVGVVTNEEGEWGIQRSIGNPVDNFPFSCPPFICVLNLKCDEVQTSLLGSKNFFGFWE
jgi:hypothetical protein